MKVNVDFLVVGPPRTGTTWLYNVLKTNDNIYLPEKKQLHYFDKNYDKGIEWYLSHFQNNKEIINGEITPDYITESLYLERIKKDFPKVKIIIIYRDPIERAFSHYKIRRSMSKIKGNFIENFERDPYLMKNSLYGNHLKNLLNIFSKDNIMILDYSKMNNEPKKALIAVEKFLNIKHCEYSKNTIEKRVNQSSKISIIKSILKSFSFSVLKTKNKNLSKIEYDKCYELIKNDLKEFNSIKMNLNNLC